jgi:hypothetical protein
MGDSMKHTCAFRQEHDLERDEPTGAVCGEPATQEIHWKDGRVSPSCAKHGLVALDKDALALVKRVTHPLLERDWLTQG